MLNLPSLKFKEVKAKKKKVKSRAEAERERKDKRPERQKKREEWLQRRAKRREEKKLCNTEPEVIKAKRPTRKSNHGTEQIDSTILKLLRKSQKSKKVTAKSRAEKWRHGMREERHEGRTVEKKRSKKLKTSQVSPSKDNLDKTKTLEERQPNLDVCQVSPIVDVGPDYQADGGHLEGNGDVAESLAWQVGPDCAAPSGGEQAAELALPQHAQNTLDPEAFCQKFYQVRR